MPPMGIKRKVEGGKLKASAPLFDDFSLVQTHVPYVARYDLCVSPCGALFPLRRVSKPPINDRAGTAPQKTLSDLHILWRGTRCASIRRVRRQSLNLDSHRIHMIQLAVGHWLLLITVPCDLSCLPIACGAFLPCGGFQPAEQDALQSGAFFAFSFIPSTLCFLASSSLIPSPPLPHSHLREFAPSQNKFLMG